MKEVIRSFDESSAPSTLKQRRSEQSRRTNARVEDVCERLRLLALELGPGSRLPTIRELCGTLNTSSATLITALDLLENEQIFYREERQGIFVSKTLLKRSVHIVFNISTFSDNASSPFWSLLWGHLTRIAEQRSTTKNEHISFHFLYRPPSQPIPEEHLSLLNSPSTDGCLVVGFNTHSDDHRSLLKVPHVVFAGGGDWMAKYDNAVSSRLAAEALARHHCQRIGYWSATPHDIEDTFYEAYFFSQALYEQGFVVDRSLFRFIPELSSPTTRPLTYQERGYLLAKEVYGSSSYGKKPDGLYVGDDLMTDGALVAFEELGIRLGEDVHLVSHSNAGSPILFGRSKHMTLLEQNSEDLVQSMFSLLESLMNGERPREDSIYIQPHVREE